MRKQTAHRPGLDAVTRRQFEARAAVLKALAHPTRLFIVEELSHGSRCVHELTEMVGADMSTVSRHLGILKSARIVLDEKCGAEVHYSLRLGCVMDFFGCVEALLAGGDDAVCPPRRRP